MLLVDDGARRVALIRDELTRQGHEVVGVIDSALVIHECVTRLAPDVVIVDSESPSRDTLEHIATLASSSPRPVVVFAEDDSDAPLQQAMRAGVSAYVVAGLQTDRRHSPGVAFVTGHGSGRNGACEPDWQALARSGLTMVIYMGVGRLASLVAGLEAGGLAADTPAAVVSAACTPRQRHVFCTLGALVAATDQARLPSPAIVIIGHVVKLAREWALATAAEHPNWTARQATG